ncbi:MAG: FHA domain-containing protein, partial [Phycisphaerales bacterium]|nr:FHA domain-containing protein [Phycisphaerales bacterium]
MPLESTESTPALLPLTIVRGPSLELPEISRAGAVIGRSSVCEVRLNHATVSRRHAEIRWVGERWMLGDLGGANGTWLNDVRLSANQAVPLAPGDRMAVGPWILQVGSWAPTTVAMVDQSDAVVDLANVKRLDPGSTGKLAHHRLQLVLDCAGRLNEASNERELAATLLESVIEGTGYSRAALIRLVGDDAAVEVLGSCAREGTPPDQFSRSLVIRASEGDLVSLASQDPGEGNWGQSIAELEIHSAMCCPVVVDQQVAACLYLDARGEEQQVALDAAGFCSALAHLGGLAMANLRSMDIEQRQRLLESEIAAGREAQQLMVPLTRRDQTVLDYEVAFHPGRGPSGDLFDVVKLSDDRTCVVLGDVTGKGVGAAVLMAAAQSYLNAAIRHYGSPALAIADVSEFLLARTASHMYLTLWMGVFDTDGTLTYVDAG